MTSSIRKVIGFRIKTYRKNKGLTQAKVAEAIDCDITTLSRYERGEYAPDGEQLVKLAEYFGVSPLDFLPVAVDVTRQRILDLRSKLIEIAYENEDADELLSIIEFASSFRKKRS